MRSEEDEFIIEGITYCSEDKDKFFYSLSYVKDICEDMKDVTTSFLLSQEE